MAATHDIVDEILQKTEKNRKELLDRLIHNPGLVATFGDDLLVEEGSLIFYTDDGALRELNQYGIVVEQHFTVRPRTEEEKEQVQEGLKKDKILEIESLKVRVESAKDLQLFNLAATLERVLSHRASELAAFGLRMDEHGNLESV